MHLHEFGNKLRRITMRYFAEVAYLGTRYHGWQIQPNANTIQQEIDSALKKVLSDTNGCVGSGRTDTGVHAEGQVFHFDTRKEIIVDNLKYKLNCILPHDIALYEIDQVTANAHARFDAKDRSYIYKIHQEKDPFMVEGSYLFSSSLDLKKMNDACKIMMTYKDFECFSKVHTEVNNFECQIKHALWEKSDQGIQFKITANRFLRNMVRAIVGTMLEIGTGKIETDDLRAIIESQNRSNAGRSVPASGLYLMKVNYPEHIYVHYQR